MNRQWKLGSLVFLLVSASLLALAQARDASKDVKSPSSGVKAVPSMTPLKLPDIKVDTTPVPDVQQTIPLTVEPRTQQQPQILATPRVGVPPGRGGGGESEDGDCKVKQFRCARSCNPLPAGWSSTKACVKVKCEEIEKSCLEELVDDIKDNQNADESVTTFQIKSNYQYRISLKFYSEDRRHFWPSYDSAYVIDDYEFHTYRLACRAGEKICYGAWNNGGTLMWGVGHHESQGCQNCCRTCNGGTGTYTIQP